MSEVLGALQRLAQSPEAGDAGSSVRLLARHLPDASERDLRLAAIPHFVNADVLLALEPALAAADAERACTGFVAVGVGVEVPEGVKLHDEVRREFFGDWLREYDSDRFRALNARLVAFFGGASYQPADQSDRERHVLFHSIGVHENNGFALLEKAVRAHRQQFRLADSGALVALAHEYDPILAPSNAARLAYQEGKLAADLHDWARAETLFQSVEANAAAPEEIRVKAIVRLGTVYRDQRRWSDAIRTYQRSLDLSRRTATTADDARSLHWLATAYRDSGDFPNAERCLRESIALAEAAGDLLCAAQAHNASGLLYLRQHQTAEALEEFNRSLNYLNARGAESAQLLHNIGSAYLELPDFTKSLEYFANSLRLKEVQGDIGGQALTLNNLARVHASQGRHDGAVAAAERAVALFKQVHDYFHAGEACRNLARIHLRRASAADGTRQTPAPAGPVADATRSFQQSIELFRLARAMDQVAAVEQEVAQIGRKASIPWWAWAGLLVGLILLLTLFLIVVSL